ncbi:hypothetical protein [Spirillospora sp. NPDC047279]|uniref:hypothetical protein n=1 Tax=Spirillospora sp. NPDC047279 TaxID=3155478 RepID=UPI0033FADCC9
MTKLKCQGSGCKERMEWRGSGRKPRYCPGCKKGAKRKQDRQKDLRVDRHSKGRAVSRFGDLWLTNGQAIRREARYVWGATGDDDETVNGRSGVFHKCGPDGLPDMGLTISDADGYGDVRWRILENARLARESDEAMAWLKANHNWWKFETFAHDVFARDITDSVLVHGGQYVDDPDEASHTDRCSFCCERKSLILSAEFCSEECMEDFVLAFGPDGKGGSRNVGDDTRGMAEGSHRQDDALVRGVAA